MVNIKLTANKKLLPKRIFVYGILQDYLVRRKAAILNQFINNVLDKANNESASTKGQLFADKRGKKRYQPTLTIGGNEPIQGIVFDWTGNKVYFDIFEALIDLLDIVFSKQDLHRERIKVRTGAKKTVNAWAWVSDKKGDVSTRILHHYNPGIWYMHAFTLRRHDNIW